MINSFPISRKYAIAFLNLYIDKIDETILLYIKKVNLYLSEQPKILNFFSLPNLSLSDQNQLIDIFLKHFKLPYEFKNLIQLLIKQNRILLFSDILEYIHYLYQSRMNVIEFEISIVHPLSKAQEEVINKFLQEKTNNKVICKYKIDKSLIAGIRIQSDKFLWDYSINKKLKNIEKIVSMGMENINGN